MSPCWRLHAYSAVLTHESLLAQLHEQVLNSSNAVCAFATSNFPGIACPLLPVTSRVPCQPLSSQLSVVSSAHVDFQRAGLLWLSPPQPVPGAVAAVLWFLAPRSPGVCGDLAGCAAL